MTFSNSQRLTNQISLWADQIFYLFDIIWRLYNVILQGNFITSKLVAQCLHYGTPLYLLEELRTQEFQEGLEEQDS